uniref:Uncharacterized protein n=1 Tax=Anguilla anguilla TaxID=7936 RepID=A0A0E9T261_ANGAN
MTSIRTFTDSCHCLGVSALATSQNLRSSQLCKLSGCTPC